MDLLKRVQEGYGLNIQRNAEIFAKDQQLRAVWNWLVWLEKNRQAPIGIFSQLENGDFSFARSAPRPFESRIIHEGEERTKILKLCGWTELGNAQELETICNMALEEDNPERAVMLAVLHFDLAKAKSLIPQKYSLWAVLGTIQDSEFNSQVKQLCYALAQQTDSLYISVALTFLSGVDHNKQVLEKLSCVDRVGFGARFLAENEFLELLEIEIKQGIAEGNLDAYMISGATDKGIEILQSYLRKTEDIQTVALISAHISQHQDLPQIDSWINQYRDILNRNMLWHARCKFDIDRNTRRRNPKLPGNGLRCYFCGSSLSLADMLLIFNRSTRGNFSTRTHTKHCTYCQKSMPRCAVCLMPYGSINPYIERAKRNRNPDANTPPSRFEDWFSWCERCHHGGHTGHLIEWFDISKECPVAGCSCTCMDLD